MNAAERTLIAGLFDRLKGAQTGYRDPEADAFINQQIAAQPHAPYAMAQTLIVQTQAIETAQARIAELEEQVARAPQPQQYSSEAASPWGPRAGAAMGAPAGFGAGQPMAAPAGASFGQQQPYGQQPYAPQQAAPSAGGGFLSGALQTAAGVAGGALLFSGIQSMFGGGSHAAATPAAPAAETAATESAATPDASPAADPAPDVASPDPGAGGWFSGLFGGDAQSADASEADADDGGNSDGWA